MKTINGAIVGLGRMGWRKGIETPRHLSNYMKPLAHVDAIQEIENINLIACVEINKKVASNFEESYGIPVYSSHEELLHKHDIDLLTIATRTPPKYEIMAKALEHTVKGIHCEKPIVQGVKQALMLDNLLHEKSVKITTGAFRRYTGIYKIFRNLAYSDFLGPIKQFTISFGSGPMYWLHSHSFDLALFLAFDELPNSMRSYYLDKSIIRSGGDVIDSDPIHIFSRITFKNIEVNISPDSGFEITAFCTDGYIKVVQDGTALTYAEKIPGSPCYREENKYQINKEESTVMNTSCGSTSAIQFLANSIDQNNFSSTSINAYLIMILSLQSFLEQKELDLTDINRNLIVTGKSPDGLYA